MSPWVHHVVTLLHICAGLFWMGWIVFTFGLLAPLLRRQGPEVMSRVLPQVQARMRRVVFWLILLLVLTGVYNAAYRGLTDPDVLFGTAYGHRFLIKVGAALLLFAIYGAAPSIFRRSAIASSDASSRDSAAGPSNPVRVGLHVTVFTLGMLAALLGLSLGG